jgi:tetratricopeptide (TPR) repeat protein
LTGIVQVRHQGIGRVNGRTSEERASAASRLAEQNRAQSVAYGNLERRGTQVSFAPEFYVTELEGAEELVGTTRLGTPLFADARREGLGYSLVLSDTLTARTEALTFFTIGLTYLGAGQPGSAITFFEQACNLEAWAESDGKEVAYLFLGSAYRRRGQGDDLQRARAAFQTAARLNPEYARAYIGLGNVYYDEFGNSDHSNPALLDLAITQYRRAQEATLKPEAAAVDARLRTNLGNAFLVKAQLGEEALFPIAVGEYEQVVADYERGRPGTRVLAAHAYLGLGMVAESWNEDNELAVAFYQHAITIAAGNGEVEKLARSRMVAVGAGSP